jgi:GNAT superfamily N-acetyltransferase
MESAKPITNEQVIVSTDAGLLNTYYVHAFLTKTDWAWKRTLEQVTESMAHSLNFGVYLNGKQIGYARVVSDYVVFAYVMDVFIDPLYRRKGYGRRLMESVMSHPRLKDIQVWRLMTADAHYLYEKFGFVQLARPGNMMEKVLWTREP